MKTRFWLSLAGKLGVEAVALTAFVVSSASFTWFMYGYIILIASATAAITLGLIGINVNPTDSYKRVASTNFDRILKSKRKEYAFRVLSKPHGFIWSMTGSMMYVVAGLIGMTMTGSVAFFVANFLFALSLHTIIQYGHQIVRHFHEDDLRKIIADEQ